MPGPAYRIDTKRLTLRCFDPKDAPALDRAIDQSRAHLEKTMNWPRDESREPGFRVQLLRKFRTRFDLGEDFAYGVFLRDESAVIGASGLHLRVGPEAAEIGYWIHVDHVGQGYATELAAALTRVGIEVHGFRRIEIRCDPDNRASARVPQKLGYVHEATLRARLPPLDAGWRDSMVWSLLASELAASPAHAFEVAAFDAAGARLI